MTKPVRIAFVITELDVGGAERCLVNLVRGIDRSRFSPIVYSLASRPDEDKDSLPLQLEEAAVPVHFLNLKSSVSFLIGVVRLNRLLRQDKIEVVQTFLFHANVVGAIAAKMAGISSVVCGIRVADPTRWRMLVERFAMRQSNKIVCVSQSVADFAATMVHLPHPKLQVIPNGIELTQTSDEPSTNETLNTIAPGRRVQLVVGRLHEQKGIDWLIELSPRLFQRLPEHDLVVVGNGAQREMLDELTIRLGVQDRIHFLGWRSDVETLMQEAEILLLPSRWEGMPNVLIEAMGAGLPVVATSVEGVTEVLGPLHQEQSVQFGNVTGFIDAIERLANDASLRRKLGTANRERIEKEFSLQTMIARYELLYDAVLQN